MSELVGQDVALLDDAGLLESLQDVEVARRRLEAASHQRIVEIEQRGLAVQYACRDVATLLVGLLRIDPGEARRRVRDAGNLVVRTTLSGLVAPPLFGQLAELHASGDVSAEHVRAVTATIDRLPDAVQAERGAEVETTLAQACREFAPGKVAALGRLVEACLNPDGVYADEAEQRRRREVQLQQRPDGTGRLSGQLDAECLAVWQAVFDALAAPASTEELPDTRNPAQRRHDALRTAGQMLLRAGLLPDSGGTTTAVQVTLPLDQLLTVLGRPLSGAADGSAEAEAGGSDDSGGWDGSDGWDDSGGWDGLDDSGGKPAPGRQARPAWEPPPATPVVRTGHGGTLTLDQVARLLTDADLLPVWLSATGGVLGLGRSVRLATAAHRRALAARDGGCSFPGCTAPAAWCESHHIREWRTGGHTDLNNLTLLCGFHHREFARRGWTVRMTDGVPEWLPPAWLDSEQRPRRNLVHHLDRLALDAVVAGGTRPPPDG